MRSDPRIGLALAPGPNPSREVTVEFSLPSAEPARIELLDLAGRRVVTREVGPMGTGRHTLTLGMGKTLPAGVYLVRLTRGPRAVSTKVVVVQ